MRTTLNLDEDALLAAKRYASHEKLSLDEAVSRLIRQGTRPHAIHAEREPLRGRFALRPARDEVITPEQVRRMMERGGI